MYTLILMSALFANTWHGGNRVITVDVTPGYTLQQCNAEVLRWEEVIRHGGYYDTGEPVFEVRQGYCKRMPKPAQEAKEGERSTMSDGVPVQ